MVSAISSQAATLNPLAYTAQTDDDVTKQATPDATANDAERGPATQVSLSQEAVDSLKAAAEQGPDAGRQALDAFAKSDTDQQRVIEQAFAERAGISLQDGQSLSDAIAQRSDSLQAMMELSHQIAEQKAVIASRKTFIDQVADRQAAYDQLLKTTPVPATELTGKKKEAAFELLKSRGFTPPGKSQTVSFSPDDHMLLTFKGDGSVWTREGNVPETEADKQFFLAKIAEQIRLGQEDISGVVEQRDALQAQYDTLYAKLFPQSSS